MEKENKLLLGLSVLTVILFAFCVWADVDTKDGTAITSTSNIDGFTSNIDDYDGQVVSAGGESALYTAATEIWDFDSSLNGTKGSHNLTYNGSATVAYNAVEYKQGTASVDLEHTDSEYLSLANHADFEPGDADYSLHMWVKFEALRDIGLFGNYNNTNGNGYALITDYDVDHFDLEWRQYDNYASDSVDCGITLAVETWYCIQVSYDASEDTLTMWISTSAHGDVFDNSGAPVSTSQYPDTSGFALGIGKTVINNDYADGEHDEVVWWKGYAISAADASALFTSAVNWRIP